ncbi:hypothetical protein V2K56_09565 [Pseudomonas alliivorans]|nr:hypothetical protein [Pseudomonas alliivorans]
MALATLINPTLQLIAFAQSWPVSLPEMIVTQLTEQEGSRFLKINDMSCGQTNQPLCIMRAWENSATPPPEHGIHAIDA